MKTAAEIRERDVKILEGMLLRPKMYGSGRAYESAVLSKLEDLAFIDTRGAELHHERELLEKQGLFGEMGAWGALGGVFGREWDYTDQLASVYARVAALLGYFSPHRRLTATEWSRARSVEGWARKQPRSATDVEARFGVPSYRCAGQRPNVFAYAGPTDEAWLYFDFGWDTEVGGGALEYIRLPAYPLRRAFIDLREQPTDEPSPEAVYRQFMVACLSGDRARILPLLLSHEDPAPLYEGAYPEDVAALLTEQYLRMDVRRVAAEPETVLLMSDAVPTPLAVVWDGSRWRVDPDPLLRIRRQID